MTVLLPNARRPEVASTSTVLDAASRAGVEIPLVCCFWGFNQVGLQVTGVARVVVPHERMGLEYQGLMRVASVMRALVGQTWNRHICMVEITRLLLELVQETSCGRCVPCRVGTRRMLDLVDAVLDGQHGVVFPFVLAQLAGMARAIGSSSRCDLGRIAGKLVADTVLSRCGEFEAHVRGSCPGTVSVDAHLGTVVV